jgi:hypothetical protein
MSIIKVGHLAKAVLDLAKKKFRLMKNILTQKINSNVMNLECLALDQFTKYSNFFEAHSY